jgi:CTP synthase (UTP-ammonia lyase)
MFVDVRGVKTSLRIALVGDRNDSVPAHRAIPRALELAGEHMRQALEWEWVPTEQISGPESLQKFDGLWCVPASPYRNMDGALCAIRWARERQRPFLGTCGGFQHAIVEYARSVLGWADAEHAETSPEAARPVITLLACALVETTDTIRFEPGSRLANAYGRLEVVEAYRCRFGLNPAFESALLNGPLRATAHDGDGEVRGIELDGHPFFVATLFQPERQALEGKIPSLALAFIKAVCSNTNGKATRFQVA